jgi:hypothetical protein
MAVINKMALNLHKRLCSSAGFGWGVAVLFLCLLLVYSSLRDAAAADESVAAKKGGAAQESGAKSNENTTTEKGDTRQDPTVKSIEHELFDPEESMPELNDGLYSSQENENEASSQKLDSGPARIIDELLKGSGLIFDPKRGRPRPEGTYDNTEPR